MKTSQWCRAAENRCIVSAHLKALSNRSGGRSAGGRRFHVAVLRNFVVQLQSRCIEPVEWAVDKETIYFYLLKPCSSRMICWIFSLCSSECREVDKLTDAVLVKQDMFAARRYISWKTTSVKFQHVTSYGTCNMLMSNLTLLNKK